MHAFSVFLFFLTAAVVPESTVTDIENSVLDYRRSMERGHVVLKSVVFVDGSQSPHREFVTTIWFDGSKLRNDVMMRYKKDDPFHRNISCQNCERDGYQVTYSFQEMEGAILSLDLRKIDALLDPLSSPVIDPRILGLVPDSTPNLTKYHIESYLGRPDRKTPTLVRDVWKGNDCWRIDYVDMRNTQVRVWVLPEKGSSVVRIEQGWSTSGDRGATHFLDSIEMDYSYVESAGIWYPRKYVYERLQDGKSLQKEVVDIEVQSLNESLDPGTFTLAGMSIPIDTPVTGYEDPRGPVSWNGQEIIPDRLQPGVLPAIDGKKRLRLLLIVNSVFLALIGGFLLWRNFTRRRTEASSPVTKSGVNE